MAMVDMLPTVNWLTSLATSLSPLQCDTEDVGRRCRWNLKVNTPSSPSSSSPSTVPSTTGGTAAAATSSKIRASPYSIPNVPRYWSSGTDFTDDGDELDASRPSFSFTCLIGLAILSSDGEKQLNVGAIYEYIQRNFPYFQTARSTWRNSVRHVLSLNKFFQKPDDGKQAAKGGVWEVKPLMLTLLVEHIAEGQRRLPAATAKHLGLPELKRFIVKSRIGKMSRRRSSSSTSNSGSSRLGGSRSSLNASVSTSMLTAVVPAPAPPPPPLPHMMPLQLPLDVVPDQFAAGQTYGCPSPSLSTYSYSDSEMAQVPELSDVDLDTDAWPMIPDYYGSSSSSIDKLDELNESAMIDQVLAKLVAEDAAAAGSGADGALQQLQVLGEAIHAPQGFSSLAL